MFFGRSKPVNVKIKFSQWAFCFIKYGETCIEAIEIPSSNTITFDTAM